MPYELVATRDSVDLWSHRRLPFEPKGEDLEMRAELRAALSELRGPRLTAWLEGPKVAGFDIENVLFYNVGCSAFSGCGSEVVRFERRFTTTNAPSGESWTWHHSYRLSEVRSAWKYLPTGTVFTLTGDGHRPASAAAVWAAAHRARERHAELPPDCPLFLRLRVATVRPVNLTEVVKRVADGVLSSLHSCPTEPSPELVRRAAVAARCTESLAEEWLVRPGPLGPAKFVWPFGNGLQWSPADDRIVACEITGSRTDFGWSVEADLFEALAVEGE